MEAISKNMSNLNTEEVCKTHKNFTQILNEQLDKEIQGPFKYSFSMPGHNISMHFAKVINCWLKIPEEKVAQLVSLIQNISNAVFMMDDIVDNSMLRKNAPCPHTIFGLANTFNSINFAWGAIIEEILTVDHPQILDIYLKMFKSVTIGQGLEIYWRDNNICPTEEEYLKMIMSKTCSITQAGIKCVQLFSESSADFTVFATNLGCYLQIQNDYKNLTAKENFNSKGYYEDISEGKFGFPTVHAINTHPEEDILRQRTQDVEIKRYCVSVIEKCGSFEYTKQKIKSYKKIICEEMAKFGTNPYAELYIQNIHLMGL